MVPDWILYFGTALALISIASFYLEAVRLRYSWRRNVATTPGAIVVSVLTVSLSGKVDQWRSEKHVHSRQLLEDERILSNQNELRDLLVRDLRAYGYRPYEVDKIMKALVAEASAGSETYWYTSEILDRAHLRRGCSAKDAAWAIRQAIDRLPAGGTVGGR